MLLNEFLESIAGGDEESRKTPALVFCFNRDMCWNVAEQVKGKKLITRPAEADSPKNSSRYDWSQGAGPKVAAAAAARRGRASCRRVAEIQANCGRICSSASCCH